MYTLFVSDLHLNSDRPEITDLFLHFLQTSARKADALYILGDLFEVWIGDDDENELAHRVKQALLELSTSGVPIYIMAGNRDFLLGQRFVDESGCKLLADPTVIQLYDTPTLLMHGDLLCTDDVPYLKFRAWAHNTFIQRLFLMLPLFLRQKIAAILRGKSQKYVQVASRSIMDATPLGLATYLKNYQVSQIIHGHTHRPTIHLFEQDMCSNRRYVLSDWDKAGSALFCYPDGTKRLINFA